MDSGLIALGMKLTRRIASRRASSLPPNIDADDLVQEGFIGFMQAVDRYTDTGKATLSTFASHRIDGAMTDFLRKQDFMPRAERKTNKQLAFLDLEDDIYKLQGSGAQDYGHRSGVADATLTAADPQSISMIEEYGCYLDRCIAGLPARWQLILHQMYGYNRPASEIGLDMGITGARVGQIRTQAIRRIQVQLGLRSPAVGKKRGRQPKSAMSEAV